jgi:hypothetical protein
MEKDDVLSFVLLQMKPYICIYIYIYMYIYIYTYTYIYLRKEDQILCVASRRGSLLCSDVDVDVDADVDVMQATL